MDKLSSHNVTIALPSHYDDAPIGALNGGSFVRFRGVARDNAVTNALLAGGVDGIGGLHELIRWSAAMLLADSRATEQDRADAARWTEALGAHHPPHVTRDTRGRIVAVRYGD
jgi:hypothetical protein